MAEALSGLGSAVLPGWWRWIVAASWQTAVLVLLLAAADRTVAGRIGARAPRLRLALWSLVPLKLVLPPTLPSLWLPAAEPAPASLAAAPAAGGGRWIAGAFTAWAIGLAAVGLASALRARRFRRRIERAAEPEPPALRDAVRRVSAAVGLRRAPRTVVSGAVESPLVVGCLRPVVALPAARWRSWSREELEHVLAHELIHVRRGDPWAAALGRALAAVYWFHPAVHLANRRAHHLRELCCDAAAAARVGPGYRRTLLRLAADRLLPEAAGGLSWTGDGGGVLERLRALEGGVAPLSARRRVAVAALTLAAAVAVLPMARRAPAGGPPAPDPDPFEAEIASARATALDAAARRPEVGSLHVRYSVLRLNALEDRRATTRNAPEEER